MKDTMPAESAYNRAIGQSMRETRVREIMARHPDMQRGVAEAYADQEPPTMVRDPDAGGSDAAMAAVNAARVDGVRHH